MTLVKIHTCSKCGGALVVNDEQKRYECPFCGVSYDYEYFQKKVILEMADSSLHAGDFPFAEKRYNFALKKEPHDPRLLQGQILSRARLDHVEKTLSMPDLIEVDYPSVERSLNNAEKNAFPEDKEYFGTLREAFLKAEELEGIRKQRNKLEGEIKVDNDAIEMDKANGIFRGILRGIGDAFRFIFHGGDEGDNSFLRLCVGTYGMVVAVGLIYSIQYDDDNSLLVFAYVLTAMILIPMIAVLILNIYLSRRDRRDRKKDIEANTAELGKVIAEENAKKQELSEIIDRLKDMDLSKPLDQTSSEEQETESDLKEVVTCPSCDGELIDNRSRALFECPYCGLTFDYEYVRHDRVLDQAEKALANELYYEAELFFVRAEETRPQDFRVLRGYALCALKVPKTTAIKLEYEGTDAQVSALRDRIAEITKKAQEEDTEYFEKLYEITGVYEEQVSIQDRIAAPMKIINEMRVKGYTYESKKTTPRPLGEKPWNDIYPKTKRKLDFERKQIEKAAEENRALKSRVLEIKNSMVGIEKTKGLPETFFI